MEEVWTPELLAKEPKVKGKTMFDVLFANGVVNKFPAKGIQAGFDNDEAAYFGFYPQKGLFEEYRTFGVGYAHDLADFETYHQSRGLRWPVVGGKETLWRFREGYDSYVKKGEGVKFYGHKDGKAVIFALPYQPAAESPKSRAMSMGPLRASCGVLCQKGLRLADLTISSRVSISLSIGSCLLSVCGRAAARGGKRLASRARSRMM